MNFDLDFFVVVWATKVEEKYEQLLVATEEKIIWKGKNITGKNKLFSFLRIFFEFLFFCFKGLEYNIWDCGTNAVSILKIYHLMVLIPSLGECVTFEWFFIKTSSIKTEWLNKTIILNDVAFYGIFSLIPWNALFFSHLRWSGCHFCVKEPGSPKKNSLQFCYANKRKYFLEYF